MGAWSATFSNLLKFMIQVCHFRVCQCPNPNPSSNPNPNPGNGSPWNWWDGAQIYISFTWNHSPFTRTFYQLNDVEIINSKLLSQSDIPIGSK
jgi:hypothetical protein